VTSTSVTDAQNNTVAVRHNSRGLGTKFTDALGQATTYSRDPNHRIKSIVDSLNRVTRYTYDDNGNKTRIADALGRVTDFSYDSTWNKVTSFTRYLEDGTAVTRRFAYDVSTGNPISSTDPLNNVTSYTYTPQGQLKTLTVPGNRTTTYGYNLAGDLVRITDPLGNETQLGRDAVGRRVSVTTPLGFDSLQQYNAFDRPTQITDGNLGVTRFSYDPRRNLAAVINPLNNTIESYQYDGRLVEEHALRIRRRRQCVQGHRPHRESHHSSLR
jgi:YD repeat-containing protein